MVVRRGCRIGVAVVAVGWEMCGNIEVRVRMMAGKEGCGCGGECMTVGLERREREARCVKPKVAAFSVVLMLERKRRGGMRRNGGEEKRRGKDSVMCVVLSNKRRKQYNTRTS